MGLGLIGWKESWREFKTPNFWRDCLIDFYVTFILLFFTLLIGADGSNNNLSTALIISMLVFANIEAFGHVQWCLMNPVAAVNFMFTARISFLKCIFYTIFDLLAAVAVAHFIKVVLPEETVATLTVARPAPGMSGLQAMVIEWVLVIMHQCAIMASIDDENRTVMIPGLSIGMATFAAVGASYRFTGGVLNPFAVFHTAVLTGDFSTQWIYWTGDFLGGLTALLLYHFSLYNKGIFKQKKLSEDGDEEQETQDKLLEKGQMARDRNGNVGDFDERETQT